MADYFSEIEIGGKKFKYLDFDKVKEKFSGDFDKLPVTLKILLENSFRNAKTDKEREAILESFAKWLTNDHVDEEVLYYPSRVLMQDFTGVPAVVDLASMRDAVKKLGGDPKKINPISPVDLVIDHSVQVDSYASPDSFKINEEKEYERNGERYKFLKWGQNSFANFRVVPPGAGICHQVNIEYLASVIAERDGVLFPDTLVGTDSHTTMVNGMGVLGWGVGGIEAEASMLGKAISMLIPDVVGFKLTGKLNEGVTATDLVLTITEILRKENVVAKFVEFYGEAVESLTVADRATISNMSPEFGSTCAFFPVDKQTLNYLDLTARSEKQIEIVEKYSKHQKLWNDPNKEKQFTKYLELDLSTVEASLAGPKRPQDRASLRDVPKTYFDQAGSDIDVETEYGEYKIKNGSIVIAAITSCTNTSNPAVMIGAGLVARKAAKFGLKPKPFVKTSLAPGSKVVTEYLKKSGLLKDLEDFGFGLVGYGCTTCIGNSGPLKPEIEKIIKDNNINAASILSGNRNFEGRVHPLTPESYLASPPLVVAYSIFGTITKDISTEPLGQDKDGNDVFLKDIWPSDKEIQNAVKNSVEKKMFKEKYAEIFDGDQKWREIDITKSETYDWEDSSSYIKNPPFFENIEGGFKDIENAKILALFGDSITTDHISPAGKISGDSPAAKYLSELGIGPADFNSYGSRRGNHEVMMRGTFANIRIKNEMLAGKEGGMAIKEGKELSIYDAAMEYKGENTPLVVIAGKDYGAGSSRDWAAKGTLLLGVKAVIAESFERIHRSNLVGMGVLPLMFKDGVTRKTLNLKGTEEISLTGLDNLDPLGEVDCQITYSDGTKKEIKLIARIDTEHEMDNFLDGGVLQSVVKS